MKQLEITVPVQNDVVVKSDILKSLNPAGSPCPDLANPKQVFTSRKQLSESKSGPNDL